MDNLMEELDSDDVVDASSDEEEDKVISDDFQNFEDEDELDDGLDFARLDSYKVFSIVWAYTRELYKTGYSL